MTSQADSRSRVVLRWLKRGADTVGVLLFLTAFAQFILQVFFRYVLNQPLAWTEEGTLIAFIWTVFWSAAFMVPIREHVTFDVVYEAVSDRLRRRFSIGTMILLVVAFVLLIPHTLDYLQFLTRKKTSVLHVPMHWVYGCYLLFLVAFTAQAAWRLRRLLGRHWKDEL